MKAEADQPEVALQDVAPVTQDAEPQAAALPGADPVAQEDAAAGGAARGGGSPADVEPGAPQAPVAAAAKAVRPRAGVPVWRTGKPDAFLANAVDTARTALEGITAASDIGQHLGAKSEGDRLVTHLFESRLPGYLGWQWFAVLTRNSRSKVVTVNELGLLPSQDSILAPEWVPWAERVRPEDEQEQEQEAAGHGIGEAEAGEGEAEPEAPETVDPEADTDPEAADVPEQSADEDGGAV
jgi:hypothetical protein